MPPSQASFFWKTCITTRGRRPSASSENVSDGLRGEQRADEVGAATLVLLGAGLVVLVAADRDVLGAVVAGELAAAQSHRGRPERQQAAHQLLRRRAEPGVANDPN